MEAISSEDSRVSDNELEWMGKAYAHKFEGNETQLNKLTLAHLDENS
jgi:hypothetical protein